MNTTVSPAPAWRKPLTRDYLLFYVAIPVAFSLMFTSFGIRLVALMPFGDGLLYMTIHLFIAWWGIDLGCRIVHKLCASWSPPPYVIITLGFFLMLVPLTFAFQALGDLYSQRYESFATARSDEPAAAWSLTYLLHFMRFSVTALPLYMGCVYGYRQLTGVCWYHYNVATPAPSADPVEDSITPGSPAEHACAGLFVESELPDTAILHALNAQEHYIRLWTDQGSDLIRFRFNDAIALLEPHNGFQVHRSWWVNPASVKKVITKGRSLELQIDDTLKVPVSLAYKAVVSAHFDNDKSRSEARL